VADGIDRAELDAALRAAVERLLAERAGDGHWEGELAPSALATATAVSALAVAGGAAHRASIDRGVAWLCRDQHPDGGWGDTPDSPANLATSLLGLAALELTAHEDAADRARRARAYVAAQAGDRPADWTDALARAYGADRTFAVPILTHAALAGLVPWADVPRLPFELAALPPRAYRFLRLHVVSYALPALIAIGLDLHRRNPAPCPVVRLVRRLAKGPALRKLKRIQPDSGGFLEAVPLSSFVAMSLADAGRTGHPVVQRCLAFLRRTARPDGSWPIDSNLSVWLTSHAALALDAAGALSRIDPAQSADWLRDRQHLRRHPYTDSPPGGWAWTHLPGGVPDADDTARAMLALVRLGRAADPAVRRGVRWLLDLQNADGGWPTFCRGWGKLPFDRSSPDITAHAIEALRAAPGATAPAVRRAVRQGTDFLRSAQRPDGAWVPLWFGSQAADDQLNPVAGTAFVLPALVEADDAAARGRRYLVEAQNTDGGWGGAPGVESSVEETALAVAALASAPGPADPALHGGVRYLLDRIDDGSWDRPAPIGLYFSRLWYSERLYPIIWVCDALGRASGRFRTDVDV
jgi:squalene-hopene/tetraprenyl-beta-curcumene cyclase